MDILMAVDVSRRTFIVGMSRKQMGPKHTVRRVRRGVVDEGSL
jgi:hypothetical protein